MNARAASSHCRLRASVATSISGALLWAIVPASSDLSGVVVHPGWRRGLAHYAIGFDHQRKVKSDLTAAPAQHPWSLAAARPQRLDAMGLRRSLRWINRDAGWIAGVRLLVVRASAATEGNYPAIHRSTMRALLRLRIGAA